MSFHLGDKESFRFKGSSNGEHQRLQVSITRMGFPGGSEVKESTYNAGDPGSIPRSGRSPEEGNGNPLQYSFLDNTMDRRAWWAAVHGVTKSQIQLSN